MNQKFGLRRCGTRSAVFAALIGVCGGLPLVGCSRSDSAETAPAPTLVMDQAPSNIRERWAEFGGNARILGYRLEGRQRAMRAGSAVSVSMYWQLKTKLDPGYKLVTRLLDDAGEQVLDLDHAGPLREEKDGKPLLPPESWVPGKVYVDTLTFTVPNDVKTWRVQLVAGLAKGEEKLPITAGGPGTDGLALIATSGTGVRESGPRVVRKLPELRVDVLDAKTKIKIDGKLDEAAWQAVKANDLVDVSSGRPNKRLPVGGNVRVLWDQKGLYVGFEAKDVDLVGGFKKTDKDPHLWTRDTVEIMVDPDGDGDNKDYYEIQINPQNLVFDTQYDDYNQPREEPNGPFGHEEWSSGLKSAVTLRGTLDKRDDKDEGYVVEAFLPWKSFSKAKKAPPALGDTWRMNFYVMKDNGGVAWSPILRQGNFHKASRFGKVLFASKDWTPPKEAPAPAASADPPTETDSPEAVAEAQPASKKLVEHVESAKVKPEAPAKAAPAAAAAKPNAGAATP
jgi:Carbohydrate family 9 binding domain-like